MNTPTQLTGARLRGLGLLLAAGLSVFPAAFGQSEPISWSLGFEEGEGYEPGPLAANARVSLLGGFAEILRGEGAFEGRQWLRFEPSAPENGLFISLPESLRGAGERTLRFQARLAGDSPDARLVIAYGETLSVRPAEGGIELEAPGAPPNFIPVAGVESGDWIDVELRESPGQGAWDLLAWGEVLKAGIPLGSRSDSLENILIFADGAIDLDALGATAIASAAASDTPKETATDRTGKPDSGTLEGEIPLQLRPRDSRFVKDDLPEAMRKAREGKIAEAEEILARRSAFERGSAMWHYEQAQALSTVAFTLLQQGYNRQAVSEAHEVARHLELASRKFGPGDANQAKVDAAFLEARVWEILLGDPDKAAAALDRTLQLRPSHASAKRAQLSIASRKSQADTDDPLAATAGGKEERK